MRPRRRVVYHWQVMADSKPAVLQGAAATSFVAAVERVKPHTKLIGLLAFGHLVIDLNQGSIPAVLPFLRNAHGLSYAEAATIVLVGTLTSSLIQPVFGYLSDQIARRWILPASVLLAGAAGTLGMLVPTVIVGGLLLAALPHIDRAAVPRAATTASVRGVNMPAAMALLIFLVAIRSWAQLGFTTFVPFYYVDYLKSDPRLVGPLLFVFLGAGALGTVVAGPLADRWGARPFMRWVFLAAIPFGLVFLETTGVLAFVMLGLYGAVLTSSFSVSIVLGQAYLPRNAGMASGLIVGFAIGAGGLGVTALGWVADRWGLPAALTVSALMPLVGFVTARFLPAPRR